MTVVSYTWAMLREVIDDPAFSLTGSHPVRLFIGSGMPTGLWKRVIDVFEPAHVVEFFATTDGQAVLANVLRRQAGQQGQAAAGRRRRRTGRLRRRGRPDPRGRPRIRPPCRHQRGGRAAGPPARARWTRRRRSSAACFAPADTWVSTEYLFRRDEDGDYWLVDNRGAVIHTAAGLVFASTVNDAVGRLGAVDLAVTYGVRRERPPAGRDGAGAAARRHHSVGGSVRGAGRSAGRQPARHRARGAGDEAQCVLTGH